MKFPGLKIIISALVFAGIFLLLNFTGFPKAIKGIFYSFSGPFQSFFWRTGQDVSGFTEAFFSSQNIKREDESLKAKNKELLSELLLLREVKGENEFLRNAMGIDIDKEFDLILAEVVGKDIFRDSILINKGLKDGVKKNQPVLTSQKTLLGKIGEVYENFSEVVLISNTEISFDAKVSETDIFGVVKGKGRSEIVLEFVPKKKELKVGNVVVSAALGGIFPEGILVGEIQEVKKSDTDPFQSARMKPSFDIKELDKLFIIENFSFLE